MSSRACTGRAWSASSLDQLVHFFALMLWAAAVLAFVGGMPQLGWAIIAVVIVVNGVFSFAQEYRAERATRALSALLPEDSRRPARRPQAHGPGGRAGARRRRCSSREGDRISADARVIRSSDASRSTTSTLTGESEPVPRSAAALAGAPSATRSMRRTWSSPGPS